MNFLIVDDSKILIKLISSALKKMNLNVVGEAYDGIQGAQKYTELKPDIVLLDVTMPNKDGRDCLIEILKTNPSAVVIMLSATKSTDVINDCLRIGAKDFIHKDDLINIEVFKEHIKRNLKLKVA